MSVTVKPPAATNAPPQAPDAVIGAIRRAAQSTGASFEYLLTTAKVESNFNPNLTVRTSSATGLFQFIEQTWLGVMKQAGKALGFGRHADAISRSTSTGRYQVADPAARAEIMRLRKDPAANAAMAGAFTRNNSAALSQRIGRPPRDSELYAAHFFGPAGAAKLINTADQNPRANAATMFPAAARANRSIFYDRQGNPRSVAGVYAELDRRYQAARVNSVPSVVPRVLATSPDTAGMASAFADAAPHSVAPSGPVAEPQPMFRSLYQTAEVRDQTAEVRGPVAPIVSQLWGAAPASAPADASAPAQRGGPLDLFQETRPDTRGLFGKQA